MPEIQEVFSMVTQKVHQDPGARDRLSKKRRRNDRHRRVGAFVVVIALVAAGAAVFWSQNGTSTQPADQNSPMFPIAGTAYSSIVDLHTGQVTPLPESIASTRASYYAVSPDGLQVAYSSCCTPPSPLYVANIDGTDVRRVSPDGVDAYGAQWSSDGTSLVYQQRNGSTQFLGDLFVLNVASGEETQITHFDQSRSWVWWFTFPSFVDGDTAVLYQLPTGTSPNWGWDLWIQPVDGGQAHLAKREAGWGAMSRDSVPAGEGRLAYMYPMDGGDFTGHMLWVANRSRPYDPVAVDRTGELSWPRWSPPTSSLIAYSSGGYIYVANPATGEVTEVGIGGNPEWLDDHTLVLGDIHD